MSKNSLRIAIYLIFTASLGLSTPRVDDITPRRGSFNGGTYVTINGVFSSDQYNYGEGNENNGNIVFFRTDTKQVQCDVITYLTTSRKIVCRTRKPEVTGVYTVYVKVDGVEVTDLCNNINSCKFEFRDGSTPKITGVYPRAGTPDETLRIDGFIVSDVVTDAQTQNEDYEDSNTNINLERVYMGASICDPINQTTGSVHGIDIASNGWGNLNCKPNSTVVDSKNITFVVTSEYGNSYTYSSALTISYNDQIYLFQTHADVTGVSPNSGGTKGGTLITIEGTYFGANSDRVGVKVGGIDCTVVSVTETEIQCRTGEWSSNNQTLFPGNRGIFREVWSDTYPHSDFSNAVWNTSASDYNIEVAEGYSSPGKNLADYYSSRFRGYFVPPHDGEYKLLIDGDDQSELYLSTTGNPSDKEKIAFVPGWSSHYYKYSEQISEPLTLVGGNHYYTEVIHREGGGGDHVNVGLLMYHLPYPHSQLDIASDEKQIIQINSNIQKEIQVITFDDGNTGTIDNFVLRFGEMDSTALSSSSSAEQVKEAIYELSAVSCSVEQTSNTHYALDYEEEPSYFTGTRVRDTVPYCGHVSLKNPGYVFYKGKTGSDGNPTQEFRTDTSGQICFAHKGAISPEILFRINWHDRDSRRSSNRVYEIEEVTQSTSESWSYTCFSIHTYIQSDSWIGVSSTEGQPWFIERIKLYGLSDDEDFYIDNLHIGNADVSYSPTQPSRPNDILITDVAVDKSASAFTVTFTAADCGNNYPLMTIKDGQVEQGSTAGDLVTFSHSSWTSGDTVTINRTTAASPPATGTFKLSWKDTESENINADIEESSFKKMLEDLFDVGKLDVQRSGDCYGYSWSVQWLDLGGNHPTIQIPETNLAGTEVEVSVETEVDGAVTLSPIPGDYLRTPHSRPQVEVTINGIVSSCSGDCDYEYDASLTAEITGISTNTGSNHNGTSITITGSGFSSDAADNSVTIGDATCEITSSSTTQIICNVGESVAGAFDVKVNVSPGGYASSTVDVTFTYTIGILSISPSSGKPAGGTVFTITGYGFSSIAAENDMAIGSKNCVVTESSYDTITCTIEHDDAQQDRRKRGLGNDDCDNNNGNDLDTSVTVRGQTTTSPDSFTCDQSLEPIITDITPEITKVTGGTLLTINGGKFGNSGLVTIGGKDCTIGTYENTTIECTLPSNDPGIYNVIVTPTDGSSNNDVQITYDLEITGIYPDHGSLQGGTKVFISGSGFGNDTSEIEVKFGYSVCEVQAVNDDLIECVSGSSGITYEVDNQGKDEDYGTGYKWSKPVLDIIVGDTVYWVWNTPDLIGDVSFTVQQTIDEESVDYDGQGFYGGAPSKMGTFSYTFSKEGTYYYTSGPVNSEVPDEDKFYIKGVVNVGPYESKAENISVTLNGIAANHQLGNLDASVDTSACPGDDSTISSCSDQTPNCASDQFCFKYRVCSTASIETIQPLSGPVDSIITITGTGFRNRKCENEVRVGSHVCDIISSSKTKITCEIVTEDTLQVGYIHEISVNIKNQGLALNSLETPVNRSFIPIPSLTSVSPTSGSLAGGTVLTIDGNGFSVSSANELLVSIGDGRFCNVRSFTYTQIVCVTPAHWTDGAEFRITVMINNQVSIEDVAFTYLNSSTPVVNDVEPGSIAGAESTLTITGSGFGSNSDYIEVTVGETECIIQSFSNEYITCVIGYHPFGSWPVNVHVVGRGLAGFTDMDESIIWVDKVVDTIEPSSGSKQGATVVTIHGSGFHEGSTLVELGSKDCEILSVNVSTIICVTGKKSAGSVDVIVTSNDVEFPVLDNGYTYSNDYTPQVTSVTPISGQSGGVITISGTRFGNQTADVSVKIDGQDCIVSTVSSTEIGCAVPAHAAGVYDIEVEVYNLGLASKSDPVTFQYDLNINGVSPEDGSYAGQKTLNITGSGFRGENTIVTVCGNPCQVISGTYTFLQCTLPAHENTGASLSCDVFVSVSDNVNTTDVDAFTYRSSLTATITSVSPARGGTGGGTNVTITGSGFKSSGNVVTIAGSECVITSESTSEILCTTEAHDGSIKTHVRVVTDDEDNIATQDNADYYYVDVWSSRWTWGGLDPPIEGDFVIVPSGQTLLLDVDTPILSFLLIQGGSFIFDEANVQLNAENILIVDGGLLQVGTEEEPFQHNATIMMHGHQRSQEIPLYGAKTLAVRNGTLDLHGIPIPVTWTYLDETAEAGDTTLVLERSVTWNVGDQIVIASTGDRHSQRENEMVTITAISGDGRTLTIDPPLDYEHISLVQTIHGTVLSTKAEVGVLTRNVVVRGSVQSEWTENIEACEAEFDTNQFATQTCFQGRFGEEIGSDQFGSQIMLFGKYQNQHLVTGRIEYVEVTHAGQAFRLGRYPIHFHLNGDVSGSYVRGCGIHHTFNRAVTIHAVDNLLVEHNVAFDIMGHAYFMEDGIEMGNIIQYNLGIRVLSSSSLLNVDVTPATFWVTNPNNTVRHNAAAGGSHFGFWYNMPVHPGGPSFTTSMCPRNMVMGEFTNNTAHSQGWYGLWVFPVYTPMEGGQCDSDTPTPAIFDGLTAWNVERGAEVIQVGAVQLHNFVISDADQAGLEYQVVNNDVPFDENGALIKNSVVIGYSALTSARRNSTCTKAGVHCPKSKGLTIDGLKFVNFDQWCCAAFRSCAHCKPDQGGFSARTKNLEFFNSPNKAAFKWQHEYWYEDQDGSFTGSANHIVLPYNGNLPSDHCMVDDAYGVGVEGGTCDDTIKLHRMAWNEVAPTSLKYKDAVFTNAHGSSSVPYHKKRITHPEGWMVTLIENDTYNFFFEYADHITNITYNARFDGFNEGDYVIINHNLTQRPDHFETTGDSRNNSKAMLTYENNDYGDWHFDNDTRDLYYLVSGKGINEVEGQNLNIRLRVYRCYYKDCIEPVPEPPPEGRPDDAVMWSEESTWADQGSKPQNGDDVTITEDKWVVADERLPVMGELFIYGTLEIDRSVPNQVINATHIFVTGGLVVGSENTPFDQFLTIFLRGNHLTPDIPLPNGPNMGSKVLGIFGRLEMHGIPPNVTWTKLGITANAGSDTITLVESVDWSTGQEILITSTSYEAWETETFTIAEVINSKTLRLNDTLQFKHIAQTYAFDDIDLEYTEAAEVGVLTRNIKIIGADYTDLFEESFGARVLIGKFVQDGNEFKGYARLSNVQFQHTGQEGWTDFYDPRYSVAFVETGEVTIERPSYVRGCTFHNGFSPAVGIFGASGVLIEDNIIHHTVGAGIIAWGSYQMIVRNLVSLTIFPGTYQDRSLKEDKTWPAGIEIQFSFGTIMANNTVTGSERTLYRVSGEKCSEESVWENNEGHSALAGVMILPPNGQTRCSRISNFFLWKNLYYGIYLETKSSLEISNVILADNQVGVLPYIYRPPSLSHETSEKTFTMENSYIVGTSPSFDCAELQNEPEGADHVSGTHSPPRPPGGGKIGFMMTNFMSGSNNAPIKAFHGIKNYPAISGITQLKDVTFVHFQESCSSSRDFAIAPNSGNQDGIHPTTAEGTRFHQVDEESKIYFFNPSVSTANPSDCVDMTCDAMRKVFITDVDGGILGSPGTIIPNAAYQWDDDPRYGLGDYRIPKMMVTNTDGSRIPYADKCPYKGIVGTQDCTFNNDWNAYECNEYDYLMMIIESMDPDTEVRRLSPIAMYSEGYVDLINGPQDHGWCHGYTCQERISTFMSVVATGKEYEMYMSSTNPQHLRLHLLNAAEDQKIVVGIWYANPQRLDVYYQGLYIMPNNGRINSEGSFIWVGKDPNLPDDQFKPQPDSTIYGENYFDRERQTLWVVVRGRAPLDIRTTPVIMVALGVPAVSVDDFFEENIVQNLANLLGISQSQIRVVDVIREGSSRRRRRSGEATVELEIGDQPVTSIEVNSNSTSVNVTETSYGNYTEGNATLGYQNLLEIQSVIVDAAQTGELSESLDVEVESLAMTDPVEPATDPTGGVRATNETGGPEDGDTLYSGVEEEEEVAVVEVVYQFPSTLVLSQAPSDAHEDWPFITAVSVFDSQGEIVANLGHSSNPWRMGVTLRSGTGPEGAQLLGNTTVKIINGVANFTEIRLDITGSGYILDFAIVYPNTSTLESISTAAFSVAEREFEAVVNSQPNVSVTVGQTFNVGFDLIDVLSGLQLTDLASYGYNWSASIAIYQPENYFGSLTGNVTTEIDLTLASGEFEDLSIDASGYHYILEITVSTVTPSSYLITQQLEAFDVVSASTIVHTGAPMYVTLRFIADYNIVAEGKEENVKINFLNKFSSIYINVTFTVIRIYEGSILIYFSMVGDTENTVGNIYSDLQAGRVTLFINGHIIEADQNFMEVNGEKYGPSDADEESGIPAWAIVLVVLVLFLLLIIIVIVIYKFCYRPSNKLAAVEMMHLTEKEEAPRTSSRNEDRSTPVFKIGTPDNLEETKPLTEDTSRPPSRTKSPGFNNPSRTPEVVSTALPPGFAESSEEHVKEDRATMFIMQLTPARSFNKIGQMAVNLVGTLSDLRKELKGMLVSAKKDEPFVLLTESLKDIDGASEKRQIVHETYASDSVLIRFVDKKDLDKLCVCGLVGQFECSLCHAQVYCSPQCQSNDWAKHIQTCDNLQRPDADLLYKDNEKQEAPPVSFP